MLSLIQRTMGYDGKRKERITTHGFRATFRTWHQDETAHSVEAVEFCLHHITGDDAAEAYKTGAMWKKRKAAPRARVGKASRSAGMSGRRRS